MQLTAVTLARALAFVEVEELNPKGRAFYPDIVAALVRRFNFQVYPTKPEEFDEAKGVTFAEGRFSEGTVDKVQIFTHGILIDTRVSTDVSAALLNETLLWAKSELGLQYEERMVKRKAFLSQLVFESTMKLANLNPVLGRIGNFLSSSLSKDIGQVVSYEPIGVVLNLDQSTTKLTPGAFAVERRVDVPFSDNKYFSTAPMHTKDHLAVLQDFEKALVTSDERRQTNQPEPIRQLDLTPPEH